MHHAKCFEIKLTLYLLFLLIIKAKTDNIELSSYKGEHLKPYNTEAELNTITLVVLISIKDTENNFRKVLQKEHNKAEHSKTGNKTNKIKKQKDKIHKNSTAKQREL